MEKILPYIPERPAKPRQSGLTMVMDKGLSVREAEDFMSVGSEYTDFVKLGFGTSLITPMQIKRLRSIEMPEWYHISEELCSKHLSSAICFPNSLTCSTNMVLIW